MQWKLTQKCEKSRGFILLWSSWGSSVPQFSGVWGCFLLVWSDWATWRLQLVQTLKMTQTNTLCWALTGPQAARAAWDSFSKEPIKTQSLQRRLCRAPLVQEVFYIFLPLFLSNCTQKSGGRSEHIEVKLRWFQRGTKILIPSCNSWFLIVFLPLHGSSQVEVETKE